MKYIIISLITIIVLLSSCFKERIDINLNDENKKVVIEAWISDIGDQQLVKLSHTTNYLDNKSLAPINGAVVSLANESMTYTLVEEGAGVYVLPDAWVPFVGLTYTLRVAVDDEVYEATAVMRPTSTMDDLQMVDHISDDDTLLVTRFSFQELEGLGDGYFVRNYKKGSLMKDSLSNGDFIDDQYYEGLYIEDIDLTRNRFEIGDTVVVDFHSIGAEASKFLQDIEDESFRGGLFDPPPVNIRSNISNGGVGFFIIGAAQRRTILVK